MSTDVSINETINDRRGMDLLNSRLKEELARKAYPPEDIAMISVSFEEMASNAIVHGNRNNPNKNVYIDIDLNFNEIIIKVSDEGPGFDPNSVEDPTDFNRLLNLIEEGDVDNFTHGRGIWMTRHYMDSVVYSERANSVVISKRKSNGAQTPEGLRGGNTDEEDSMTEVVWHDKLSMEDIKDVHSDVRVDFGERHLLSSGDMSLLLLLIKRCRAKNKKVYLSINSPLLKQSLRDQAVLDLPFVSES